MGAKPFELAIVFTGHMVDLPGRPTPRFPADMERQAADVITSAVERSKAGVRGGVIGISSGARGGDTLFQEACRLHGIETRMVLPFPPEDFVKTSVEGVPNSNWVDRFWANWNAVNPQWRDVLTDHVDERAFALCNQRVVETARILADGIKLIAFWNGQTGDGPGGTSDMVQNVKNSGGEVEIIDTRKLLAGAASC